MLRIRQINDVSLPANAREIAKVQEILRDRFPAIRPSDVDTLPEKLSNPLASRLRTVLLVADDLRGTMHGFAVVSHASDVGLCVLDFVATTRGNPTRGVGGALYARVRDLARELGGSGLFFECLPDDPAACTDPTHARENAARLRFYERFGARPIIGTAYEMPLSPGDLDMPHLVYDPVGRETPLGRDEARRVVRALLERKYGDLCSPAYIDTVVESFQDDPVRLRPAGKRSSKSAPLTVEPSGEGLVALVVNDRHDIHHVRERGYVESPVRIASILTGLEPTGLFWKTEPREYPESHIRAVHDDALVDYLKRACAEVPEGKSVYPYVFPIRNQTRPPKDRAYAAGYYCIDTFTPLNQNAYKAARRAVACTLTAADIVRDGQRFAYALVRPPGHHAESRVFGGFCYFCNAAIGAHRLAAHGRVAILDIDYHHGNGMQDIFYDRADVLTVSIHGHPSFAYPFFTGFEEEIGEGAGAGFNLNLPLPESVNGAAYTKALGKAFERIRAFEPRFLVVALGFDTAKGDPTGTWTLTPSDFEANGRLIAGLGLPTLVVQEGGYRTTVLATCARAFFTGLAGRTA
ncbi:MAG: histone deacetylase family protein [Phycisphaerales bacterium]|nr:histone deacetylase family protein [Phycisphaerales bacterium]